MCLRNTVAITQTHNICCVVYTDPDAASLATAVHGPVLHLDLKRGFLAFSLAPSSGTVAVALQIASHDCVNLSASPSVALWLCGKRTF